MNNYDFKDVVCPFFKRHNRRAQTITCEGLAHVAAANVMLFADGMRLDRYFKERCCQGYLDCPVAKGLMDKYQG